VKNKEGTGKDSPDTARALIDALHREWIMNADGSVDEDDDEGLGVTHPDGKRYVEVAPAASYAGEYLEPIVKSYFMGFVPAGASIEPLKKEGTNKRSAEDPAQGDEPPAKK
jgi:UDP-N-acetylglucosamine/UDP-N-acetylgalactosamine diphosphorylase